MRYKIGKISGFLLGAGGFLTWFRLFVLPNVPPNDELAPGAVLMVAIFVGLLFAFVGSFIQGRVTQNKTQS